VSKRWSQRRKYIEGFFDPSIHLSVGPEYDFFIGIGKDKKCIWRCERTYYWAETYQLQQAQLEYASLPRHLLMEPEAHSDYNSRSENVRHFVDMLRAADRRVSINRLFMWSMTLEGKNPAWQIAGRRFGKSKAKQEQTS
jgi:hypothetical protein